MLKEETRGEVACLEKQPGRVILGKPDVLDDVMVALFNGSHNLMEDVPGTGKTTLAKALLKVRLIRDVHSSKKIHVWWGGLPLRNSSYMEV